MKTIPQRLEDNIDNFTAYYSIILAIFLELVGLSQYFNASSGFSAKNFFEIIEKINTTPLNMVAPWIFKNSALAILFVSPIILLWVSGRHISSTIHQYGLTNDKKRDLIYITRKIFIPFFLLFLSLAALIVISFSAGSSKGALFWFVNFLLSLFVIAGIFFKITLIDSYTN